MYPRQMTVAFCVDDVQVLRGATISAPAVGIITHIEQRFKGVVQLAVRNMEGGEDKTVVVECPISSVRVTRPSYVACGLMGTYKMLRNPYVLLGWRVVGDREELRVLAYNAITRTHYVVGARCGDPWREFTRDEMLTVLGRCGAEGTDLQGLELEFAAGVRSIW
mgnify:FL=1